MKPANAGKKYHLIGVGGVGMSALAQALLDLGHRVSGSDRAFDAGSPEAPPIFATLRAAGVHLSPQNGSGIQGNLHAVITSTAVEPGNPDLEAAARAGVPVRHRAECLAELVEGRRLIAVAGTAGKTTVTAMIGWILEQVGSDPTVINGGELVSWARSDRIGSVRTGQGPWAVVEVDESDRSLLQFRPEIAIVTNISKDHFELDDVCRLFGQFAHSAARGLLAPSEIHHLLYPPPLTVLACPKPVDIHLASDQVTFQYGDQRVRLAMPGRHNVENARLALAACEAIGVPPRDAAAALAEFRGVKRRLECVGFLSGAAGSLRVPVFDDYAHNPAKIAASWTAVAHGSERVIGVWRPHGFCPLSLMFNELISTFTQIMREQDELFLLPVYYAGGTARGTRTAAELAQALGERGKHVRPVEGYEALEPILRRDVRDGDTLLIMGARDPGLSAFARRLIERRDPT